MSESRNKSSKEMNVDKLSALININSLINSSYTDVNALLVHILEAAMHLVQCESSSLLLIDKENSVLHFEVALGPKGVEAKRIPVDSESSIAGWVVRNNRAIIVNDARNDPRLFSKVQNETGYITKSILAVPMRVHSVCIGVIELLNKADDAKFDKCDLELLELLSSQVSIAYYNADSFREARNKISDLQQEIAVEKGFHNFIFSSKVVQNLLGVVDQVAKTDLSVLIQGDSGVGKELFAEQVHLRSSRADKQFVRVNCAAFSPTLLESELFGHVKGAFTDAHCDRKGRFEVADGGTIFLDEIGELPLDFQAKLLRVIQHKTFERVGSSETISVDVRIIAATNKDLEKMVADGTFRNDLYFRLNVLPLNIPPLRSRKEDIMPLADFFRKKFSDETKKTFIGFSDDAIEALLNYKWPGNIRELENSIERACVLGTPPYIRKSNLFINVKTVTDVIDDVFEDNKNKDLKTAVNEFKKRYIQMILSENRGNQTVAAKILDIQRTYLSRLIKELDIE